MDPDLRSALLFTPHVRFPDDYAHRLSRAKSRVRAARERREGAGPTGLLGAGEEFVGYRPYASGDDLRHLDWSLLARFDRPHVRVMRRESSEHWLVRLDATASMGVGDPSKLQLGAELALALATLGIASGASVRVEIARDARVASALSLRSRPALAPLRALLESTRAEGSSASAENGNAHVALSRSPRSAQRVFVLGDLADANAAAFFAQLPPRSQLVLVQILARHELAPFTGLVRWLDPESGERLALDVDEVARARYSARLHAEQERWRVACARRGAAYASLAADMPFEHALARLFGS